MNVWGVLTIALTQPCGGWLQRWPRRIKLTRSSSMCMLFVVPNIPCKDVPGEDCRWAPLLLREEANQGSKESSSRSLGWYACAHILPNLPFLPCLFMFLPPQESEAYHFPPSFSHQELSIVINIIGKESEKSSQPKQSRSHLPPHSPIAQQVPELVHSMAV